MTGKKKRKHPRLERPKKQYEQNQCALYGIKGKNQLLKAMKWNADFEALLGLVNRPDAYKEWVAEDGRVIQEAGSELRALHARIATLLRRITPPGYRHSGIRGRSFLTNAAEHREDHPSLKLDVRKFYPSTTWTHVRDFFVGEMKCAADVSAMLADLCCYKGALPTGGVHSEVLAFYCHKVTFDALAARVEARGGRMTVYVDDVMVTMPTAGKTDLVWARRLFAKRGMTLHPEKCRVLPKRSRKVITGVVIKDGKMAALPDQHLKTKQRMADVNAAVVEKDAQAAARSLLGHLDHIAQIEERFKDRASGNRSRLRRLLEQTEK